MNCDSGALRAAHDRNPTDRPAAKIEPSEKNIFRVAQGAGAGDRPRWHYTRKRSGTRRFDQQTLRQAQDEPQTGLHLDSPCEIWPGSARRLVSIA
jgi:hypothetical protein